MVMAKRTCGRTPDKFSTERDSVLASALWPVSVSNCEAAATTLRLQSVVHKSGENGLHTCRSLAWTRKKPSASSFVRRSSCRAALNCPRRNGCSQEVHSAWGMALSGARRTASRKWGQSALNVARAAGHHSLIEMFLPRRSPFEGPRHRLRILRLAWLRRNPRWEAERPARPRYAWRARWRLRSRVRR